MNDICKLEVLGNRRFKASNIQLVLSLVEVLDILENEKNTINEDIKVLNEIIDGLEVE